MQSEPTDRPARRVLAHLRAVFVLGLVTVCLIAALPMPGPSTSRALKDPAGQQELQQWVDLFGAVGIETNKAELSDFVMAFSKWARGSRRTLMAPFRPVFRITAAQQGWGLFAYPDTHPHALMVLIRREGDEDWTVVYDSDDPSKRWMGPAIHYRRVRATYNPALKPPKAYSGFATWIANTAFDADPTVKSVRVQLRRQHTTLPGEPGDGERLGIRWRRTRHRPDPNATPKAEP